LYPENVKADLGLYERIIIKVELTGIVFEGLDAGGSE
jgi:hypothetical protein